MAAKVLILRVTVACLLICYMGLHVFLIFHDSAEKESIFENRVTGISKSSFADSFAQSDDNASCGVGEEASSVDYFACCGLGHRMSKQSNAYFVAKHLGFTLSVFWGFCGNSEIFHHLFEPDSSSLSLSSKGLFCRVHNEVHGFRKRLVRRGNSSCDCHNNNKFRSDAKFYQGLRQRFRWNQDVADWMQQHGFANHTVLGLHVRAGNGEEDGFRNRGRAISNISQWVSSVTRNLMDLASKENKNKNKNKPVLLYLATDTPSMVEHFRGALANSTISMVSLSQSRPREGEGVWFGRQAANHMETNCLEGWRWAVMDMILLSHANVVLAGRPSSFTQSMPMMLAFHDNKPFCEFSYNGTETRCFTSFLEWCCQGVGSFSLGQMAQRYEFIRIPDNLNQVHFDIQNRCKHNCTVTPTNLRTKCLPRTFAKTEP